MAVRTTVYYQTNDRIWGWREGSNPEIPRNSREITKARHDQLEAELQAKVNAGTRAQIAKSQTKA